MTTKENDSPVDEPEKPPEEAPGWQHDEPGMQNHKETRRWSVLRKAFPNHPITWFHAAVAHIEVGEFAQAQALQAQAKVKFPNHPGNLTIPVRIAILRQQFDEANKLLQQAREKYPANLEVWQLSAKFADDQGEKVLAETSYQQACECTPHVPGPLIQLAEFAMREERWEEALKHWEAMRNRFPDNPQGYVQGAEVARILGRTQEARQLALSHQYGENFVTSEPADQNRPKTRSQRLNFIRLLELIWTKAKFDLRSEVHRNYLSYGWWVLEPLLHMVVYYVVFGLLLQRGGDNFPVFLLAGLVPWMWFMKAVSSSSNSILAGQNLMLEVGLPSIVFPLVSLVQASLKQILVFILLAGFLWLQGFGPAMIWWALIPVIFVQALLTIAFACAVAAIIPFIRDLSYLVPTGLMFLMFMSGIFYDYRRIPLEWQELFLLNPMAFLLKCYRDIFMDGVLPEFDILAGWGIGSLIACLLVIAAYKRLRYTYPRIVLE